MVAATCGAGPDGVDLLAALAGTFLLFRRFSLPQRLFDLPAFLQYLQPYPQKNEAAR